MTFLTPYLTAKPNLLRTLVLFLLLSPMGYILTCILCKAVYPEGGYPGINEYYGYFILLPVMGPLSIFSSFNALTHIIDLWWYHQAVHPGIILMASGLLSLPFLVLYIREKRPGYALSYLIVLMLIFQTSYFFSAAAMMGI